MATCKKVKKRSRLRNNEYYDMQSIFDNLYDRSKEKSTFKKLYEITISDENIRLAYRNLKGNIGSNTPGTDGKTMKHISSWSTEKLIYTIKNRLKDYKPQPVRRVDIPKQNGKTRPLGIPTIVDRIIQQCIKQVLEPILEAKFHERSNGFRPNRSTENAIAQSYKIMQVMNFHYVVDIDIKEFFDTVHHGKLLKQLWSLGIRDKRILSIISKMLKGEVAEIGFPEQGTPQGSILSPLLSNVVLNELDWWIASQWEEMPTHNEYSRMTNKSGNVKKSNIYTALRSTKLKECYIVRYCDDFKIFCRNYNDARKLFIATRNWLKERLGLEISEEKSKIINLRKNYSKFLGFKMKVRKKGKKRTVVSHVDDKALKRIKENAKERIKEIQRSEYDKKSIDSYNSYIIGIHNYYKVATHITKDINSIADEIRRITNVRLRTRMTKTTKRNIPLYIKEWYGKSQLIRYISGNAIIPMSYVQHKKPMYKPYKVNNYTLEGRKIIHDDLQCVDTVILKYLVENPIFNESIEVNDNRISLYVAQRGKCAITGNPLVIGDMQIIRKETVKSYENDKYRNLMLICREVYILINEKEPKVYEEMLRLMKLSQKRIEKIEAWRNKQNFLKL